MATISPGRRSASTVASSCDAPPMPHQMPSCRRRTIRREAIGEVAAPLGTTPLFLFIDDEQTGLGRARLPDRLGSNRPGCRGGRALSHVERTRSDRPEALWRSEGMKTRGAVPARAAKLLSPREAPGSFLDIILRATLPALTAGRHPRRPWLSRSMHLKPLNKGEE